MSVSDQKSVRHLVSRLVRARVELERGRKRYAYSSASWHFFCHKTALIKRRLRIGFTRLDAAVGRAFVEHFDYPLPNIEQENQK